MIYKVRARIIEDSMADFYQKLTDGTIASQKPDGEEILDSMKRAVITEPDVVEWYETCYCDTPLHHERTTQYDSHFTELVTEEVDAKGSIQGEPFWAYLKEKA